MRNDAIVCVDAYDGDGVHYSSQDGDRDWRVAKHDHGELGLPQGADWRCWQWKAAKVPRVLPLQVWPAKGQTQKATQLKGVSW